MSYLFESLLDIIELRESSSFHKFFPYNKNVLNVLHRLLSLPHDVDIKMSETNNRHVLWDNLRDGKALFVSINQKTEYKEAREQLVLILKNLPKGNRAQNSIQYFLKYLLQNVEPTGDVAKRQFLRKKVKQKLSLIKGYYPNNYITIINAIELLLNSMLPAKFVLLKRVPELAKHATGEEPLTIRPPSERDFPVRAEHDKTEKVFGQSYMAWEFSSIGDIISTKEFSQNAITVFRSFFDGWGDRTFYIIEDSSFKPVPHPSMLKTNLAYKHSIPLTYSGIEYYTRNVVSTFKGAIVKELKTTEEQLKRQIEIDLPNKDSSSEDLFAKINDYRKLLGYLNTDIEYVNFSELFSNFLKSNKIDSQISYKVINTQNYLRNKIYNNVIRNGMVQPDIKNIPDLYYPYSGFDNTEVKIRKRNKNNRILDNGNAKYERLESFISTHHNVLDKYEMYDEIKNRWVPIDPTYSTRGTSSIIVFETDEQYLKFNRNFALYLIRNIVKRPEVSQFINNIDIDKII